MAMFQIGFSKSMLVWRIYRSRMYLLQVKALRDNILPTVRSVIDMVFPVRFWRVELGIESWFCQQALQSNCRLTYLRRLDRAHGYPSDNASDQDYV